MISSLMKSSKREVYIVATRESRVSSLSLHSVFWMTMTADSTYFPPQYKHLQWFHSVQGLK